MLTQQGLDDVTTSSVPEQVAFLLVERAKLLDALENEVCTFTYIVKYVAVKFVQCRSEFNKMLNYFVF